MSDNDAGATGPLAWVARNKLVTVFLALLVVALATGILGVWESPASASEKSAPAPQSVKDFAAGQTTFDAQLIWGSLSDDLVQDLAFQGIDVSAMQARLDEMRDSGVQWTEAAYVGGHRTAGGDSYYLYLLAQKATPDGDVQWVPYTLTVAPDGKIKRVQ